MLDTQKEKRKNSSRNPYLLIAGIGLIVIGAIAAFVIGSQTSEAISPDCITQTGYQMAILDGHDLLISNPEMGIFEKLMVNLSRLSIVDMRWSPDGRYIMLLASEENAENYDVYVFNPAGGRLRNLTGGKFPLAAPSIAWSPDGKTIGLLSRDSDGTEAILHYVLIDPDNGNVIWSADSEDMFNTSYGNLWSWSPDSQKLALIINQDGFYNLHVYDLETDSLIPMGYSMGTVPAWSPDSAQLLLIEPDFQIIDATKGKTVMSLDELWRPIAAYWGPGKHIYVIDEKQNHYDLIIDEDSQTVTMSEPLFVTPSPENASVQKDCLANQSIKLITWNPIPVSELP